MARGVKLTQFEIGQIVAHRANGVPNAEIARMMNRSRSCITKCLKRVDNPPQEIKKIGRPTKVTSRVMRRVKRSLKLHRSLTTRQLIAQNSLQMSKSTLIRALNQRGCRWRRMKRRPAWKLRHITTRLEFARLHMTWGDRWRNVIFTDEKKFNFDGPDGYKYFWHGLGSAYEHYSKRVGGGKSLMIWCGFGYGGKLELQILRGRVTAIAYQNMLQNLNLEENGELIGGGDFVFQQDNASPHAVRLYFYHY